MADEFEMRFRALCIKVVDESDPGKVEILKQRLRLMLLNREDLEKVKQPPSDASD